jgi:hypothetical protein
MKSSFNYILFFCLAGCFSSCVDQYNICDLSKAVEFKGGFYAKIAGVENATQAAALSILPIGSNVYLYNQEPNISKFTLVPNPSADTSKYFIKVSNTLPADTISLVYTTQSVNLSPECGNIFVHNLTRVLFTTNSLDSVKIINTTINNTSTENVKIYY